MNETHEPWQPPRPRAILDDGEEVSIQASTSHYCVPRTDKGPYTALELGFPSFVPSAALLAYAEDPEIPIDTVYPYVPVELVEQEIAAHGGLLNNNGEVVDPANYWWRT